MKNYLITGIAGTGKSAIGDALAAKGYRVPETDSAPNNKVIYRYRVDPRTGNISTFQRGSGWEELRHVIWKVDPKILRPDLTGPDNEIQFVCGYANNWNDFRDDFDGIFLLSAPSSIIKDRLLNRTTGDWGRKHPEELKHAIETADDFNNSVKQLGAIIIDSEKPIDEIVKKISELIG